MAAVPIRTVCVRCGVQQSLHQEEYCACGGWLSPHAPTTIPASKPQEVSVRGSILRELLVEEIRFGALTDQVHRFRQDHVNIGRGIGDHLVVRALDRRNKDLLSERHVSFIRDGRDWIVRNNSRSRPIFVDGVLLPPAAAVGPAPQKRVQLPVEVDFDSDLTFAIWVYDRPVPRSLSEGDAGGVGLTPNGWRLRYLVLGGGASFGTEYVAEFSREQKQAGGNVPDCVLIPAILADRYEIEDVLSAGGFGTIYIAADRRLGGRRVLVKARRHDATRQYFKASEDDARVAAIEAIRSQIEIEAANLLRVESLGIGRAPLLLDIVRSFCPELHGPHPLLDGGTWSWDAPDYVLTEPYLIMQWIEGETLEHYLLRQKNRDTQAWRLRALRFTLELCDILGAIHNRAGRDQDGYYYIYQDLKPANVIVTDDEFLTLLDFGGMLLVARLEDGSWDSCVENGGEPGLGTPGYKPPEMDPLRFRPSGLNDMADVYTIGATLFYLLTGQDPNRICPEYGPIPAARLVKGFVPSEWGVSTPPPPAIVKFLRQAVAESRQERFVSAEEMKKACEKLFSAA